MITYQVEDFNNLRPELETLLPLHWEEIALNRDKIKLDVDWDAYQSIRDRNALHVLTVRDDSKLIGYHICIVTPHLHYKSTLHALTDVYYILPEYRKGMTGIKMFKELEKSLRSLGVKKVFTGTKMHLDMGRIFEHLGYNQAEKMYSKYLE